MGKVHSRQHGEQQATYVCGYLVGSFRTRRPVDFYCSDGPENPRPDAWCAACEDVQERTGGEWTDGSEAFADIRLLCGAYYDLARALSAARD
jgi:hypothetical protein